MKLLSDFLNHISNTICYAGICGGAGYLAHRVVSQVDPATGLVCGAVAGATTVLFFNENANLARKAIGVAILVFAPLKICERLKLPAVSMPVYLAVTGMTAALAIFIQIFHEYCIGKQKQFELEFDLAQMDQFEVDSDSEEEKKFEEVLKEMKNKKYAV